jgi:hypothetical protein
MDHAADSAWKRRKREAGSPSWGFVYIICVLCKICGQAPPIFPKAGCRCVQVVGAALRRDSGLGLRSTRYCNSHSGKTPQTTKPDPLSECVTPYPRGRGEKFHGYRPVRWFAYGIHGSPRRAVPGQSGPLHSPDTSDFSPFAIPARFRNRGFVAPGYNSIPIPFRVIRVFCGQPSASPMANRNVRLNAKKSTPSNRSLLATDYRMHSGDATPSSRGSILLHEVTRTLNASLQSELAVQSRWRAGRATGES